MDELIEREAPEASEDENSGEDEGFMRELNGGKKAGEDREGSVDSSDEEDDDDDEEAEKAVREGFIVDSDEEEEEAKRKRKRRRERQEQGQEELDEEDLDLVLENAGIRTKKDSGKQFKRLKRGPDETQTKTGANGLQDIFSDDEEAEVPAEQPTARRGMLDEFADFIENDYSDDEAEREEREVQRFEPRARVRPEQLGLSEDAYEKVMEIFGDGDDYDWALEDEAAQQEEREKAPELRDVFEPSELEDRMLTEEDQVIRSQDVPERFQIMRKPFAAVELSATDLEEESEWIANRLLERRQIARQYLDPALESAYRESIKSVLEFFLRGNLEPPFVWQHRRDFLVHTKVEGEGEDAHTVFTPLVTKDELWQILELDIRFRSLIQKRDAVRDTLKIVHGEDVDLDALLSADLRNAQYEDFQDLHDYAHFNYSQALRDFQFEKELESNGEVAQHKRPSSKYVYWERMRRSHIYGLVKEFGITAESFAGNVANGMRRDFTQDPDQIPELVADRFIEGEFNTWEKALRAAKELFAEEIVHEPQFRKAIRITYFREGTINIFPSERGIRKIDDTHEYAEFKYLRQWPVYDAPRKSAMFLRMLRAEQEGLVDVKIQISNGTVWFAKLCEQLTSDNYSEIAEAWNNERRQVLEIVLEKLDPLMQKAVKENLKGECESILAREIRTAFYSKLNTMPWRPHGFESGEVPKVLAVSCGRGEYAGDATLAVFLDEFGQLLEHVKFDDLQSPEKRSEMVDLIKKTSPDVVGIAGFSVETRRLEATLSNIIEEHHLKSATSGDDQVAHPLKVVFVHDEVARLYQNSKRASLEFPDLPTLSKYCVALARYLQSPLLEFAAMGKDVLSVPFHAAQSLLSDERLLPTLESALVDIVNKVGVDINEATRDSYKASVMQYVCGLGPRKWSGIQKAISQKGGWVQNRSELITNQMTGKVIFMNCASFFNIPYKPTSKQSDAVEFLDSTRLHPEDYELGRKMAADALELDEEDLVDLEQSGGVVYELQRKGETFKLNELVLELYADELEKRFNQKKRVTLDIVKWELQTPYGELRSAHDILSDTQVFTMLTGEVPESFQRGSIVSANVRKVGLHEVVARLDCGIEATIDEFELSDESIIKPSQVVHQGKTVEAVIEDVNYSTFQVQLSCRPQKVQAAVDRMKSAREYHGVENAQWADLEEERDRTARAEKQKIEQRSGRVIKHPLFRPFNAQQAEQYLSTMQTGDAVIRPSSLGPDHIAVTWKVGEGLFQHVDVLELGKDNEFSLAKLLRVNNKYTYQDLDELIVAHIKAMSRKVDEITNHEKFQKGAKSDTEKWLTTYTEANPKRSSYAFCVDTKHPGYFNLCFKAGLSAPVNTWSVKVVPNGFSLRGTEYGDMTALCNGFKMMFTSMAARRR